MPGSGARRGSAAGDRRWLGQLGEAAARRYLEARGLRTIAANVRTRYGEIDLVCTGPDGLVFVEVKTRTAGASVGPLEAISSAKAGRLVRLAQAYLAERQMVESRWQIDLVAVVVRPEGQVASISHVPCAVEEE